MNEPAGPSWMRDRRLVAALLFLATILVHLPAAARGTFHFDDMHSIVENQGVRSLSNIPRFFADPQLWSAEPGNAMYRPTLLVTYAIDYALWRDRAAGWLLTNVLVHAAVVVLVFRLALRLGLSHAAAFFAGTVFALHPALTEVQNYVSSRSESVAALLLLGAFHCHLSGRERSGGAAVGWFGGALVLSMLALGAKETTALFFAAVLLFELIRRDRGRRPFVAVPVYVVGLMVMLAVRGHLLGHAAGDVALTGAPVGPDPRLGGSLSILDNVLKVQSRVVVVYYQLLARPVALNIDYAVERSAAWSASAVAALVLHAAIVVAAVAEFRRGRRLALLCVGWFWLFLAPSVAFPLNVVMNEHRLYLPMIAAALAAGAVLGRVSEVFAARSGSTARGIAMAGAPLLCFVPLIVQRSAEWRDDETLWTVAVARAPESARAHMHLGAVFHTRANDSFDRDERVRLLDAALEEYAKSDALLPDWSDLQFNLGNAWLARGQASHDRADLEAALAAHVKFGSIVGVRAERPRLLQAVDRSELGEHDEAIVLVEELRQQDATVTTLYDRLLAKFLRKKGDRAGAAAAMERVISVEEPEGKVDGLLDLGWWFFEDGDLVRAEKYLGRAWNVAKKSGDTRPPLYIARFLTQLRQPGALKFLEDARRLGWDANEREQRWIAGGPTPGVFSGTSGWTRVTPPIPRTRTPR